MSAKHSHTPEWHLPTWIVVIGFLVLLILGIGLVGQLAQQQHGSRMFYNEFGVRPENKSPEAQEKVSSHFVDLCEDMLAAGWYQLQLERNPTLSSIGLAGEVFDMREAYDRHLKLRREMHESAAQRRAHAWELIGVADYPVADEGCTWNPPGTVLAEEEGLPEEEQ